MSRNVSQYFNNYNAKNEQRLIEDLMVEAIQICGVKIYYAPRTLINLDSILGEDNMSTFSKAFAVEAYPDLPGGWEGQRDILSKFGLEMRDQSSFTIARRRFVQAIRYDGYDALPQTKFTINSNYVNEIQTQYTANEVRPMEGDLIYLPITNDIFEITFVDHESTFHQLGEVYVWRMYVKKFTYSSEIIDTGIPQIDRVQQIFQNVDTTALDRIADNAEIKTEASGPAGIINFDELNVFGEPDGYEVPFAFNLETGDYIPLVDHLAIADNVFTMMESVVLTEGITINVE